MTTHYVEHRALETLYVKTARKAQEAGLPTVDDRGAPLSLEDLRAALKALEGSLRLWWIPQIPGKPFIVPLESVAQGAYLYDVLAKYDIFQHENKIKPDFSNAGGIEIFEDGEWVTSSEWEDLYEEGLSL